MISRRTNHEWDFTNYLLSHDCSRSLDAGGIRKEKQTMTSIDMLACAIVIVTGGSIAMLVILMMRGNGGDDES